MNEAIARIRILIIEDECKTAASLRKGLSENGFAVDVVGRGDIGARLACEQDYDLIILDVMLPARDGWSILAEMRHKGKQTSVLFLTACDEVHDRVKGLELGADDYLVKPFAFMELLARVRSLVRRIPVRQPDVIAIADMEIDLVSHKVMRSGRMLDLSQKEFQLLSLLARRRGEVLSRKLVVEQVWDMFFDSGTNVVDVAIRRLRKKVDEGHPVHLIHTVRGMGYVLEEHS